MKIPQWRPSKNQIINTLRLIFALSNALLAIDAAGGVKFPAWLLGSAITAVGLSHALLKYLNDQAQQEAYLTPSPLQQQSTADTLPAYKAHIPVPEPPER